MSLRQSLLLLFLSSGVLLPHAAPARQRQTAERTVEASGFPGADLGAKINAADRALGSAAGVIVARGGGRISTPVVISERHTLRLMPGTYAPSTKEIPVLLKSGASLVGAGRENTVLLETTAPGQFFVVAAFNSARRNGDSDSDIAVRDLQIKGANPGFDSAQQAIALGNCKNCVVERVWLNATRTIGIQLGGSAQYGNFAENSRVTDCLFTNVASQNLALVNGRNITFENNRFVNPGQPGGPGSTVIDLEPNGADDHLENVVIRNNLIDARTHTIQAGNGIVIQSGSGTRFVGPVLVEGNTIYGGSNQGTITNILSNGIYAFGHTMKDVTIRNNKVIRTGQSGLRIEGTRFTITGNEFTDVGGGGIPGFYMGDVSDSRIEGNRGFYSGNGPSDFNVQIVGQFKRNTVRNNGGMGFPPNAGSQ
ncbi:MAG TPA: right-handed parallel beta-helix repeat-containing protein [Pyrinomonadaceae bacterium]|jgi:hypothetical protein